jgi:hypothetical protein
MKLRTLARQVKQAQSWLQTVVHTPDQDSVCLQYTPVEKPAIQHLLLNICIDSVISDAIGQQPDAVRTHVGSQPNKQYDFKVPLQLWNGDLVFPTSPDYTFQLPAVKSHDDATSIHPHDASANRFEIAWAYIDSHSCATDVINTIKRSSPRYHVIISTSAIPAFESEPYTDSVDLACQRQLKLYTNLPIGSKLRTMCVTSTSTTQVVEELAAFARRH